MMELNSKKTKIQKLDFGIDFIGYFVKTNVTFTRKKVVNRLKEKLFRVNDKDEQGLLGKKELKKICCQLNSYLGHFSHSSSFRLRNALESNKFFKKKV